MVLQPVALVYDCTNSVKSIRCLVHSYLGCEREMCLMDIATDVFVNIARSSKKNGRALVSKTERWASEYSLVDPLLHVTNASSSGFCGLRTLATVRNTAVSDADTPILVLNNDGNPVRTNRLSSRWSVQTPYGFDAPKPTVRTPLTSEKIDEMYKHGPYGPPTSDAEEKICAFTLNGAKLILSDADIGAAINALGCDASGLSYSVPFDRVFPVDLSRINMLKSSGFTILDHRIGFVCRKRVPMVCMPSGFMENFMYVDDMGTPSASGTDNLSVFFESDSLLYANLVVKTARATEIRLPRDLCYEAMFKFDILGPWRISLPRWFRNAFFAFRSGVMPAHPLCICGDAVTVHMTKIQSASDISLLAKAASMEIHGCSDVKINVRELEQHPDNVYIAAKPEYKRFKVRMLDCRNSSVILQGDGVTGVDLDLATMSAGASVQICCPKASMLFRTSLIHDDLVTNITVKEFNWNVTQIELTDIAGKGIRVNAESCSIALSTWAALRQFHCEGISCKEAFIQMGHVEDSRDARMFCCPTCTHLVLPDAIFEQFSTIVIPVGVKSIQIRGDRTSVPTPTLIAHPAEKAIFQKAFYLAGLGTLE